jgi:hypothetical protein
MGCAFSLITGWVQPWHIDLAAAMPTAGGWRNECSALRQWQP